MADVLRLAFKIGSPRDVAAELTMLASGGSVSHCGAVLPDGRMFTSLFEAGPSFQQDVDLTDATEWIVVPTTLIVTAADVLTAEVATEFGWTYDLEAAIASGFGQRIVHEHRRFCSQITKEFCQNLAGGKAAFPGPISVNPWELMLQATGKQKAFLPIAMTYRRERLDAALAAAMAADKLTAAEVEAITQTLE